MARRQLLPTPTAGDAKQSGSWTSVDNDAHDGTSLTDAVLRGKLLPTPVTDTHRGRPRKNSKQGHNLETASGITKGLCLSPRFVEAMMMLPRGWTALGAWETP